MVIQPDKPMDPASIAVEAYSGGVLDGALVVMACITIVNMRRKVTLHKLILVELLMGMPVGTYIFPRPPVYQWYASVSANLIYISYNIHNIIAWMKVKPFLSRRNSFIFIATIILAVPYWIFEAVAFYLYFGGWSLLFTHTRPFETLFRDPWWVFTVLNLFWNIRTKYQFGYLELIQISPRFGVLLLSMVLSLCFMIVDVLAVTNVVPTQLDGINPYWKMAFLFKCLTDTIILDDFKSALDKLQERSLRRFGTLYIDRKGRENELTIVPDIQCREERLSNCLTLAMPDSARSKSIEIVEIKE